MRTADHSCKVFVYDHSSLFSTSAAIAWVPRRLPRERTDPSESQSQTSKRFNRDHVFNITGQYLYTAGKRATEGADITLRQDCNQSIPLQIR